MMAIGDRRCGSKRVSYSWKWAFYLTVEKLPENKEGWQMQTDERFRTHTASLPDKDHSDEALQDNNYRKPEGANQNPYE